ncbi:hypothetical protein D3C87_2188450 [compost metagenome]
MAAFANLADALTLGLAWLFVITRIVHSAIQCGYNKVMHRFFAYVSGALALWALWIRLGTGLLA